MQISHIDHIVLTVADIERSIAFYTQVLGFQEETFGNGRKALKFGCQKINLHQKGREFEPKAAQPTCGAIDLCLISATPLAEVAAELQANNIPVIEGIVGRTGAEGAIRSLYIRDPDGNLIEISEYV
ncbi:VOC family protein [Neisseria perflava]|uniref:VOC family protein n=1 Tax=Neisseria perflava TaxID=33053 RepID=UPI0020A01169|nr:VOC family protein [Neisseria perflava]MCP1659152.1 catechol 2,3-dioxygenase-like lactoylglutathione lyase family enzyme [Neisseria perflava]MCP1771351.1 catechol 2,3-dioxygenase-like lactoylglutathione lyase family enzyme [Neisseria perflava]